MRDLRKWFLAMLTVGVVAGVALIHPSTASAQTPVTLTLTPITALNTVGTSHTVTATVTDATAQPVPGVVVRFFVGGPGPASGSCTTGTNGQCTFSYTGPQAGQDFIFAFADTDNDEQQDIFGEPQAEATKTWVPPSLVLTPLTATNTVRTSHTVTATVRRAPGTPGAGQPMPGVVVRFFVGGVGPASGSCTTGTNGQCTFSYTGTQAGQDFIVAYADTDNDDNQDIPGETVAEATKTWVPPSLVLTPLTATNEVGTSHTVTATVRRAPGTPGAGQPMPGVVVRFFVGGVGPASGSCTTGTNGQCTFSYTGTQAGQDFIVAYADTDNDDNQDIPGETVANASKTWVPATPGCPDNGGNDDEDGDGLTKNNESLFSTLLGNADSDFDGIADGNDDANGNSDDDEDEDDDEDDECPDEDSDDDGEDDEDEDDEDDDDDD